MFTALSFVIGTSSKMIVASATVGDVVPAPVVIVAPCKVTPFVMVSVEVQLAVPAGTITVSPSEAEAMADVTSAREGLTALMVAPLVCPTIVRSRPAMKPSAFGKGQVGSGSLILNGRTAVYIITINLIASAVPG